MKNWKIEKGIKKIGKIFNKCIFMIEFILAFLLGISMFKLVYDKNYMGGIYPLDIIRVTLTGLPLLAILIYSTKKNYHCYEKLFLTFMIPIGMLYLIFITPGYVPDEDTHIYRTYSVSQGQFIVSLEDQKEYIPKAFYETKIQEKGYNVLIEKMKEETDYETLNEEGKYNTLFTYSALMYLVPGLVFRIGSSIGINLFVLIYLARLANFFFVLLLGYYTIKILPFGKLLMMVYLFNPMYISEGISLAADSFINSTTLLFLAYNINLLFRKEEVTWKHNVIYLILAFFVSYTKHVYFPMVFMGLALLIWSKAFHLKRNKAFLISCMLLMSLVAVGWFVYTGNYVEARPNVVTRDVNASEQIKQMLQNPGKFLEVLGNTMEKENEMYLLTLLGMKLGLLNIVCSGFFTYMYLFLLFVCPFLEKNDDYELTRLQKLFFIFMAVGLYLVVLIAMYASWSDVGADSIIGVQGRYFIPFAVLIPFCFVNKNKYLLFKHTNLMCLLAMTYLNLMMIGKIIEFLV